MENFILSKEDYIEFLNYKKEKLLKQVQNIEQSLQEVLTTDTKEDSNSDNKTQTKSLNPAHVLNSNNFAGWKYFVDEVLLHVDHPLSSNEIVSIIRKNPQLESKKNVAKKSVGSALSMHSPPKKNRYTWIKDQRGIKKYSFNKDFKE